MSTPAAEDHEPISVLECRRNSFYEEVDRRLQEMGKNRGLLHDSTFNDILEAISTLKECSSEDEHLEKLHQLDKKAV